MKTQTDLAERLEIFFGAASEAVCRVYARVEVPQGDSLQLTGKLIGPTCAYAHTLPATSSFVDRGPGPTLLAEAVVPDPSFWTPAMPHLYRVEVQIRSDGKVLMEVSRAFGIRPLGTDGRKLMYAGKNWVLRAVSTDELPSVELADLHDADTAILASNPDDTLCEAASRTGVLIVADLETADTEAMRRLSRWPAVGIVVLPGDTTGEPMPLGRNTIVAQRFAAGQPVSPASWAQAAVCTLVDTEHLPDGLTDCPIPVIAFRPAGGLKNIARSRADCDGLQRDLARHGQFAGYIV